MLCVLDSVVLGLCVLFEKSNTRTRLCAKRLKTPKKSKNRGSAFAPDPYSLKNSRSAHDSLLIYIVLFILRVVLGSRVDTGKFRVVLGCKC